jgi:hypothetical protein
MSRSEGSMTASTRALSVGMISLLALLLAVSLAMPVAHAAGVRGGRPLPRRGLVAALPRAARRRAQRGRHRAPDDTTEIPRATVRDQTNPYRGEYTRVSTFPTDEGDETIAAFGFDLFDIGGGAAEAQITGGTVTFAAAPPESGPQTGDGANGQRNEENAAMVACVVTDFFAPDFAGNWEQRPPIDEGTCAPLELLDEGEWIAERPTWTLDLAELRRCMDGGQLRLRRDPRPRARGRQRAVPRRVQDQPEPGRGAGGLPAADRRGDLRGRGARHPRLR